MERTDKTSPINVDAILDTIADIIPNASSIQKYLEINSDTILNNIADGVIVTGLDGNTIFINRAAINIIDKAGAQDLLSSAKCSEVFGQSGCTFGCLIKKTIQSGEALHNYEASFERGGRSVVLSVNTALLRDKDGAVIGGIEIFRDISIIKELKKELSNKYSFDNIVGRNHKMHQVFELLHEVAPTRATVLIEGETGTGKELIANAIHHNSTRAHEPFVKINCAALSEGLLESELFGHVKGAFTGAINNKVGRFELADKGTIFLDEIGDIPPKTQVKLLRVLQDGEFDRVGSSSTTTVDVRVISATNHDLKAMVERGEFREDLYYRLKVVPIHLPALRERKNDIPLLVNHFIEKYNREMKRDITNISPAVMELLLAYNYPGNIRELDHLIEHAFVRCQGKTLNAEHFPNDIKDIDLINRVITDAEPLKALEREMIRKALNETGWKYKECAEKLKMSRTTLWRRMKELNIVRK
ncbi:MAG: sigma-54 interaction domain-containing protein [Thermodesulfobacteriota bacterium]